jgi:Ca2+-binding EF-hand superfamily protein
MGQKTSFISVLLLLALMPRPAGAASDVLARVVEEGFDRIDHNKDGKITREEFALFMEDYILEQAAEFEASFAQIDVDGNGAISREEAAANKVLLDNFDIIDADRDGQISKVELGAAMLHSREATTRE